jgi:hypothetical protein
LSVEDVDGEWSVERIDDSIDVMVTEGEFERDPRLRIGTAYCGPATAS